MRARQILPAGLTLLMLLTTSACGAGGLRVEGAEEPVTTPSVSPTTSAESPKPMMTNEVDLAAVRRVLLASKHVDPDARKVLTICTVVERCLRSGATVDVMHSGRPQVVVTINTIDNFIFGAFLLALDPAGPRLVWSLKAEQLKIYPSKQGDLVVESKIFGTYDRACCPSGSRVEVYRWSDGRMIRLSSTEQKGD
ncbi:MAG: hypothetical protein QOG10_1164 [Kribbellaceae bacterium]|jgi:hypothetical protein|nr:hypothetical protein [Kribbellaceae bacterium]